jgi:uncharacterized protein with HEPN domain
MALIQSHYQYAWKDFDEFGLHIALESWHSFLSDLDVRMVFAVVNRFIANDKKGYPPTIAHILEDYHKMSNPTAFLSPEEEWETVKKAIKNYGSYREGEALASLSASTSRAVKSIGWKNLCLADDKEFGFMRNRFIKDYDRIEADERSKLVAPNIHEKMMKIMADPRWDAHIKKLESKTNDLSEM